MELLYGRFGRDRVLACVRVVLVVLFTVACVHALWLGEYGAAVVSVVGQYVAAWGRWFR